jgi:amidase
MALRIRRENVFFSFSNSMKPVARLRQGEEAVMETHDCFQGQLTSERDLISALDWSHVNPATGPVFVEGAKPGDILRIDISSIDLAGRSTMVTIPGEGALGDVISKMETAVLTREKNELLFRGLRLQVRPMIGVIGVAPETGEVSNGTPGPHGGNMDCRLITAGASLYLTVGVEGALFGAGYLHAAMGDGEVVVCGAESAGEIGFTAHVVDFPGLPTPMVENDEVVAVIVAASTSDQAAAEATHRMAKFLTDMVGIPLNDAGMLMSLVGQLAFCQIVDPLKTVRFEMPKKVLQAYGFAMR